MASDCKGHPQTWRLTLELLLPPAAPESGRAAWRTAQAEPGAPLLSHKGAKKPHWRPCALEKASLSSTGHELFPHHQRCQSHSRSLGRASGGEQLQEKETSLRGVSPPCGLGHAAMLMAKAMAQISSHPPHLELGQQLPPAHGSARQRFRGGVSASPSSQEGQGTAPSVEGPPARQTDP